MADIEALWIAIRSEWEENLEQLGVNLPSGSQLNALMCLYDFYPDAASQAEMVGWFQVHGLEEYHRQARHLAADGWDIRSGNTRFSRGVYDSELRHDELRLNTLTSPNPVWLSSLQNARVMNLSELDWQDILDLFIERGCAVCGRLGVHYDKGHLDSSKPYEVGNIVPMCVDCNNWGAAKGLDFQLDERTLIARPVSDTYRAA